MDLVHEQDVAGLERGQDRCQVALPLERRAGDRADPHPELLADDEREARLPEPGRADEQDVVERPRPCVRAACERDRELLLDARLADEVVERARAERALELVLVRPDRRCQELRRGAQAALNA